jgi:hypothetical protein
MPKTILAFGKEMDDTFVLPLGIQGASVRISGDVFPAHYRSWWRKQTSSADICAGALDVSKPHSAAGAPNLHMFRLSRADSCTTAISTPMSASCVPLPFMVSATSVS